MAVTRTTSKVRHWNAWAGTVADLRRIAIAARNHFEARQKIILAEFDNQTSIELQALDELEDPDTRERKKISITSRRKDERRWLTEGMKFAVKIVEGVDVVEGEIEEVLSELDRRSLESVTISARFDAYMSGILEIKMTKRAALEPGVDLAVKAQDQGWVRQTFSHLTEEIEKGTPKWAWLRSGNIKFALAIFFGVVLFVGLVALAIKNNIKADVGAVPITLLIAGLLYPVMRQRTWDYIFPPLDLTGEDGTSTGSRRITFIAGLFITVALGVFVNMIS